MKNYNRDFVVSYNTIDEKEASNLIYLKETKSFFGKTLEEGFYELKGYANSLFNNKPIIGDKVKKLPKGYIFKGNKIYEQLSLELVYINNEIERIYFNNYTDLKIFIKRNLQGKGWS